MRTCVVPGPGRLADNEIHPDGACSTRRRFRTVVIGRARVIHGDCMEWLKQQDRNSIHAVVTDPPYGLVEYSSREQEKLRNGTGGVWRIPPVVRRGLQVSSATLHGALAR